MSHKSILVHKCFSAVEPKKLGEPGSHLRRFDFHAFLNQRCSCSYRVDFKRRDAMLTNGDAYVLTRISVFGKEIPDFCEIVLAGKRPGLPRAQSVVESHIERAYVEGKLHEQDRIESYGQLNQEFLAAIGALMVAGVPLSTKISLVARSGISWPVNVAPPMLDDGVL